MANEQILVVEDDMIIAEDIRYNLLKFGYQVCSMVSTGPEAIQATKELRPDLVLMDIVLSGETNGIEVAGEMLRQFQVPVIYLTAYADSVTLKQARKTEPFGYILKPFSAKELNSTIEMALYKHKIERKLKEKEQWLQTTLKSIGDGVISVDSSGKITLINPTAESLTGFTADCALGRDISEILTLVDGDKTPSSNPIAKALQQGSSIISRNHQTVLISRQGEKIPIDYNAAPIEDEQDGIIGVVLVFSDVTEIKHMHQQIQSYSQGLEKLVKERSKKIKELEKRKLEIEKVAAAGQIAAGVAHEINNPLAGIKNSFLLLKDAIPESHKYFEYVGRIESEIDRIGSIVRQMYQLYQPQSRQRNLFDPCAAAEEIILVLTPTMLNREITLKRSCADVLPKVCQPAGQFKQVLYNIIINAIHASYIGSSMEVKIFPQHEFVIVEVVDEGPGIAASDLPHIFEPFYSTKHLESQNGLGLGLSVSQSLMVAMGGKIEVESQEGDGATFKVFLPIADIDQSHNNGLGG